MRFFTTEFTTAPNVAPITTATARSTAFPRRMKCLKPFSIVRPSFNTDCQARMCRLPFAGGTEANRSFFGGRQHTRRDVVVRVVHDGNDLRPRHHHADDTA